VLDFGIPTDSSLNLVEDTLRLEYQITGTIFQAFLEQADRSPNSKALVSSFGACSYGELEEISARIASALRIEGVQPRERVVILSGRNPALVYAMLGVSRIGASFSIVDLAYPPDRIARLIGILNPASVVICGSDADVATLEPAHRFLGDKCLIVPPEAEKALSKFGWLDNALADASIDPKWPAYVTFTSGSTGGPKGVTTNHVPLCHFISWHATKHKLTPDDRFSLLAGLSHDPIYRDVFTPLSIGASLYIPEQRTIFEPRELVNWLAEHQISVAHLTPGIGEFVCAGAESAFVKLPQLRYLFWGGEKLSERVYDMLSEAAPNAAQVNFYGTTETPQAIAFNVLGQGSDKGISCIGKGIDDVQLLLINDSRKLAETGEVGEIWVRSPYLSQGYFDDDGLTNEKFVANPLTGDPDDICYRTGDLGKYLSDGAVMFIGRADQQVKIRGFRVEPAEVADEIEKVRGVTRALVIPQEDAVGNKILVGYFTCGIGSKTSSDDVISALLRVLPNYMVPSSVVQLDAFPLLPSGKIDLQSLARPKPRVDSRRMTAPINEAEEALAKLWAEILGVEKVGVNDDFQSLGGDSLSALRLLFRMKIRGIPHNVARGVLQGRTIRQIACPEIKNQNSTVKDRDDRVNLLVNIVRGLLLAIVIAGHWFPTLVRRLPELSSWERSLDVIFDISTPGFAFVFGLTLGKIYFPRYRMNPVQARRMLLTGTWVLWVGALMVAVAIRVAREGPLADVFTSNVILYYALAFATAPIWLRVISLFELEYVGCGILMIVFYFIYQTSSFWLGSYREYEGLTRIGVGLVTAKFNYFNMSFGVLGGCAAGIYLAKNSSEQLSVLSRRFSIVGMACVFLGLLVLFLWSGSLQALGLDNKDMGLWRWLLYSGLILLLGSTVAAWVRQLDNRPIMLRQASEVVATFGQCTFPIFVVHFVLWQLKPALDRVGVPDPIALASLSIAFIGFCALCMGSLYRLHYGEA
jgi:amino acid adenylation domain-containing protein